MNYTIRGRHFLLFSEAADYSNPLVDPIVHDADIECNTFYRVLRTFSGLVALNDLEVKTPRGFWFYNRSLTTGCKVTWTGSSGAVTVIVPAGKVLKVPDARPETIQPVAGTIEIEYVVYGDGPTT